MNKPTLLFVYDHKKPEYWMDGLYAALNLLESDFHLIKYNLGIVPEDASMPDFILGWGAFGSRVDQWLQKRKQKKGLCIAGNAFPPTGADDYNVLFYETKWYRPQINFHQNIVQAFGINSDIFFKPDMALPIVWDYIGVGAFAEWKRWGMMGEKKGTRLVIGEVQQENNAESMRIINNLISKGVMVSDMVHPFDLAHYYQYSRTLYMPSNIYGGGERAVLEARACGLNVEIEEDNPKLKELIELEQIPTHHDYAEKLKKGILSVL